MLPSNPHEVPASGGTLKFAEPHDEVRARLAELMPVATLPLTPEQQIKISLEQEARLTLGPAASAPMLCAGQHCPIAFQCTLVALKQAPINSRCPFEVHYVTERFAAWLAEIGRDLHSISETERLTVASLVHLDVEENRIRQILAHYQRAKLTSQVVRDVDVETGVPLCFEDIIDPLLTRLNEIITQRRMLLKDFELTPEMKTRRRRVLGVASSQDLASRQSALNTKLRKVLDGSR